MESPQSRQFAAMEIFATNNQFNLSVSQVFEQQVDLFPNHVAIESGDESITYRQLDHAANRLANQLRQLGVTLETRVGIAMERSIETIIAFLAVLKAGGAYVPLDPEYPKERLLFMINDTNSRIVIVHKHLNHKLPEIALPILELNYEMALVVHETPSRLASLSGPNNLIYIMYTSGSTGRPKGVAIEHRGILHYTKINDFSPTQDDFVLHVNPLVFDNCGYEIWGALLNGARLIIHPSGHPIPEEVIQTIQNKRVTIAFLPTGLFHQLVDQDVIKLRGLRIILAAGDVLSTTHAKRLLSSAPHCRLINAYGPTETTINVSAHEVQKVIDGESIPIGQPFSYVQFYILDADLKLVPYGAAGELYIGGEGIARGYLNLPKETSERFITDPFSTKLNARLYKSGDLVRLGSNGELEFIGRVDHMVKIRGFRVEPMEVAMHINMHPNVHHVAVIGREDLSQHKQLVAYVVFRKNTLEDLANVREFLQSKLPNYMIPSAFVKLDEIPTTITGKLDRSALPDPAATRVTLSPTTPTEIVLAAIWKDILILDTIYKEDNFFELGGDSLLVLKMLARIREKFSIELSFTLIFKERTLARIAQCIDETGLHPQQFTPPKFKKAKRPREIYASYNQAQACFFSELADETLPYQSQCVIWFDGALDIDILQLSLTEIIRRHELLRTTFKKKSGGEWIQIIHDCFAVKLHMIDLSEKNDKEESFRRLQYKKFRQRIPLDQYPLIRWTLVRLETNRHALLQVEHHVVHDGWTTMAFLRELITFYDQFIKKSTSSIPELSFQYADFSVWQRELIESKFGINQINYWIQKFQNAPPRLDLPFDHPRPKRQTFRGDSIRLPLDPNLITLLKKLAEEEESTLYTTMLTAFLIFLYHYGAGTDIVIGSGLANRRIRETEEIIGMMVNTVALRTDLSDHPNFVELLERVNRITREAQEHQEIPFEKVIKQLAPERDPRHLPLYQVMFSFHDSPLPNLQIQDCKITLEDALSNGTCKADLNVIVAHQRNQSLHHELDKLILVWEYNTDLFNRDTAKRMLNHFLRLLTTLTENRYQHIEDFSLITDDERVHLLRKGENYTLYERDSSIGRLFETRVEESKDDVALCSQDIEWTYEDLNKRVNQLAHYLSAQGASSTIPIALMLNRSAEMIVALLAILKTGAPYLPLDPSFPLQRLKWMIEDANPSMICTTKQLANLLPPDLSKKIICLDKINIANEIQTNPEHCISANSPAYIMYTSGSTGIPKGVVVPHRAVIRLVRTSNCIHFTNEIFLMLAPFAFDASTFEIWGALLNGARLVIAPSSGTLSPPEIAAMIERHKITTLWLTAGLFHQFVDQCPQALSQIHQLITGGDVISPRHANRALRYLPKDGVLINGYGPTEATTFACCHRMKAASRIQSASVPIGLPIQNTRVYVLDEKQNLVAPCVPGELYIGGDALALHYLNQPDLTNERFIPNPFLSNSEGRLYRTGDRVRWNNEGVLEFLGRTDRQIKISGYRVELEEIENVIMSHPAVSEAVVIPWEFGPRDKRLVSYVKMSKEAALLEAVITFVRERLPKYQQPSSWMVVSSFKMTPNGKIDRNALPEPRFDLGKRKLSAANPIEKKLIKIWEKVLGVHPIHINDNFFDLGGHSLLAIELLSAIEQEMGQRFLLATIFEAPTISQFAKEIQTESWKNPSAPLVPLKASGKRPALFYVTDGNGNAVGFNALTKYMHPDQPFYVLVPPGLDGRHFFHTSVETLAQKFVREICIHQPKGPYFLSGRCFGGLVAYEMARMFEQAGEEVRLLAIFDSLGPKWKSRKLANDLLFDEIMNYAFVKARKEGQNFGDIFNCYADALAFMTWLQEPVYAFRNFNVNRYLYTIYLFLPDVQEAFSNLNGEDALRLIDWSWRNGQHLLNVSKELLPSPTDDELRYYKNPYTHSFHSVKQVKERCLDGFDVLTRGFFRFMARRRQERLQSLSSMAGKKYEAPPYQGKITLIRSQEYLEDLNDFYISRWYGIVSGGVDEHILHPSHVFMLREPDVSLLADYLEERLINLQ